FAGERRSWAAEHGQVGPPWVEAGNRDRLRRLVLTGRSRTPFSCQASTISCHISWRSSSRAVTWEFTQLRSSSPQRKDRTEFLFRVSRKRRRATGRRPSEARARGCDREL